ncbi:hypothetical protein FOA52_011954 [Chlamydomonas sp. UWO 241]|nr:hypothetical protein FOA52_011954 [Chlamydomonas sp. UWO 241]
MLGASGAAAVAAAQGATHTLSVARVAGLPLSCSTAYQAVRNLYEAHELYPVVAPSLLRLSAAGEGVPPGYRLLSCREAVSYAAVLLPLTFVGDICKVDGGSVRGASLDPSLEAVSYTVLCRDDATADSPRPNCRFVGQVAVLGEAPPLPPQSPRPPTSPLFGGAGGAGCPELAPTAQFAARCSDVRVDSSRCVLHALCAKCLPAPAFPLFVFVEVPMRRGCNTVDVFCDGTAYCTAVADPPQPPSPPSPPPPPQLVVGPAPPLAPEPPPSASLVKAWKFGTGWVVYVGASIVGGAEEAGGQADYTRDRSVFVQLVKSIAGVVSEAFPFEPT